VELERDHGRRHVGRDVNDEFPPHPTIPGIGNHRRTLPDVPAGSARASYMQ